MIRYVMTALLVAAGMVPAHAGEKSQMSTPAPEEKEAAVPHRVYELRTYYVNDGKLVDLHKRFRDHTCALLKKHGAELIGFWTPTDEKDGKDAKLIYLVAFPSREAAKKTWEAFGKDPEWQKARDESHKNGVLVKKVDSVFMEPTDYSAMK
jgi:uncharacterized protein (DUF1330 family)